MIVLGPPPPLPLHRWHCTIVHCELKQILGCCIFDVARALPAHYRVVIQKHSPEVPPHRISLSRACYGYHDLRQRATLHPTPGLGGRVSPKITFSAFIFRQQQHIEQSHTANTGMENKYWSNATCLIACLRFICTFLPHDIFSLLMISSMQ